LFLLCSRKQRGFVIHLLINEVRKRIKYTYNIFLLKISRIKLRSN
jgi:hypothetical protein